MEVAIIMNWKHESDSTHLQDPLWKIIDLPCLPPVGTRFWFDYPIDGDWFENTVESVEWCESSPMYEVNLAVVDVPDGDDLAAWFSSCGWSSETTHPVGDAIRARLADRA